MKIQQLKWSGWTRSISIGLTTLALAVTVSLPTVALAKEKAPSAKVSKQKSAKAASHKAVKAKAKLKARTKVSKPAKKRLLSKKNQQSSQVVWNNAHESKQAYYIMPESLGGKVATPQAQPDYLQVSAHQHTANTSPPARTTKTPAKSHQVGTASFYSDKFHGGKTASGERFDQNDLTCAHGSLPFGCRIRVTNLRNNKAVEVKVNDRGSFHKHGRVIDLSKAAAKEIGMVGTGTAKVKVEVLE